VIRPIHPFPARMAPGLAVEKLGSVPRGSFVLDPMAGSGTVLRQATELGHQALGFDTDPLAVLMAKVWTRPIDGTEVDRLSEQVTAEAKRADAAEPLHWIDDDPELPPLLNIGLQSLNGRICDGSLACWQSSERNGRRRPGRRPRTCCAWR
jgi:hypothetical protein